MYTLKLLRKGMCKTQADVAKDLGISQQAYGNYEVGRREPDSTMLQKLADYFGVTVDFLLGREESSEEIKKPIPEDELDKEIIERFSKLSATDAAKVSAFIEGLLAAKE